MFNPPATRALVCSSEDYYSPFFCIEGETKNPSLLLSRLLRHIRESSGLQLARIFFAALLAEHNIASQTMSDFKLIEIELDSVLTQC